MNYPDDQALNMDADDGKFTGGDPVNDIPASILPAEWLNDVTDELLGVISSAGLTPDIADKTQLITAIRSLSASNFTTLTESAVLTREHAGIILIGDLVQPAIMTLPPASDVAGMRYRFIRVGSPQYTAFINTAGGDVIRGSGVSFLISQTSVVDIISDGIGSWVRMHSIDVGTISLMAQGGPSGWIICSGVAVSRTIYHELFSRISTIYGVGDGTTTFNVPDLSANSVGGIPYNIKY